MNVSSGFDLAPPDEKPADPGFIRCHLKNLMALLCGGAWNICQWLLTFEDDKKRFTGRHLVKCEAGTNVGHRT